MGASGELMGLFWPRIDFADNVHEAMPAVYLGQPREGVFHWTWEELFERSQQYLGNSNILVTQLKLPSAGLEIILTDFCPCGEGSEAGDNALVRHIRIENRGSSPLRGLFMHYFDLRLGELSWKQAVRYDLESGHVVQYLRDFAVAVGGTKPDLWRCGKWSRQDANAKNDMLDGYLDGQAEDIGQCNFALAWRMDLDPDRSRDVDLILAFDTSREGAVVRLQELRALGRPELQRRTHLAESAWLQRSRPLQVAPWLASAHRRALMATRLLTDHHTCAVIAAPEFDPNYELCGGYGYCWPRDAAEAVLAMAEAGYPESVCGLARWLAQGQLDSGVWGQRYWTSGDVAASWSLRHDFLQVDQSASAVIVLAKALEHLATDGPGADAAQGENLRSMLETALRRGAQALVERVEANGYHCTACDLWETYAGVFAYTQAGMVAALRAAAEWAQRIGDDALAQAAGTAADRSRLALMGFYQKGYFARGLTDGRLDPTVDSSSLGLVEPFGVLDLTDPDQRAMAVSNLSTIEERLGHDLPEGRGIRRYEGDGYLGGAVGAVNTLWTALVCYRLALSAEDARERGEWATKAEGYVRVALAHATPTGLLPELIPVRDVHPYWAAPHAWSSGLVVRCALAADELASRG